MKILVTGSSGMLGTSVVKRLLNSQFDVYGLSRSENSILDISKQFLGDLTNNEFLKRLSNIITPEIIVHTAANVDLLFCEQNPIAARTINAEASGQLAKLFPSAIFIYISTDSVFDGIVGDYMETDITNPLNQYAKSKLYGESLVLSNSKYPIVLRTNIYGRRKVIGNSLAEWAYKELIQGMSVKGYSNIYFNPLHICQLADVVFDIIATSRVSSGLFHLGCEEKVSKMEFIKILANQFDVNDKLIEDVLYNDSNTILKRPLNTTLNTSKFEKYFEMNFSLFDGIKQFRDSIISNIK